MFNSKKIWKGINEIIHNKSSKDNTDIYLDDNGNILTDQKKVANKFNKFYTNVANNLLQDLGDSPTKFQDYLRNPNEHSIYFGETDPGEIAQIIGKLDISKSGDLYGITPKLVKWAPGIATNLSIIYNRCIELGVFPHLLKITKVISIHKGDSKMVASNYRPISLLPIFGKIFEKIIFKRLSDFVIRYKILYEKQYGFQRAKSTEDAIIDITQNILNSLEKKEHPCCVFLDFAKAFDTVNHKILLSKLHHYGIRGMPLQLIESYLSEREQCVQVNNAQSDFGLITHGVPQGSILGPLLFLLYINDIAHSSSILSFYLFADDTAIFLSKKYLNELEDTINIELVKVSQWLIANKLSLNLKKSNAILFRTKNDSNTPKINLKLNGVPIAEVPSAKYLGLILDQKLSYEEHIKHVDSKLIKGNVILAKVRHFVPVNILTNSYNAHIQPHIDYGLNLWGYAAQTFIDKIIRKQKKSIRIMCFKNSRESTELLFPSKNILPFHKNLQLQAGKLLWKAANSYLCPSLNPLFHMRNDESTFHVPHRRLDVSQNSVTYAGVKTWNAIPPEIRSSTSPNCFKGKFKGYLSPSLNDNNNNNQNNVNRNNRYNNRNNNRNNVNFHQGIYQGWRQGLGNASRWDQ